MWVDKFHEKFVLTKLEDNQSSQEFIRQNTDNKKDKQQTRTR